MHILKFVPHLALMINRRSRRAILDHMACTHYPEGIFDDTSDEAEQELERLNNNYNAMLWTSASLPFKRVSPASGVEHVINLSIGGRAST